MTKTISNVNTLARKALPITRARYEAKTIGGINKTATKYDSPAPVNGKIIVNMVEEAINLSHKPVWTFAQRLNGR